MTYQPSWYGCSFAGPKANFACMVTDQRIHSTGRKIGITTMKIDWNEEQSDIFVSNFQIGKDT